MAGYWLYIHVAWISGVSGGKEEERTKKGRERKESNLHLKSPLPNPLGRPDIQARLYMYSAVCALHFNDWDKVEVNKTGKLKQSSIQPTSWLKKGTIFGGTKMRNLHDSKIGLHCTWTMNMSN